MAAICQICGAPDSGRNLCRATHGWCTRLSCDVAYQKPHLFWACSCHHPAGLVTQVLTHVNVPCPHCGARAPGQQAAASVQMNAPPLTAVPAIKPPLPRQIAGYRALGKPTLAAVVNGMVALIEPAPRHGGKCSQCARELSSTLDAYYGRDEVMAQRCTRCRPRGA